MHGEKRFIPFEPAAFGPRSFDYPRTVAPIQGTGPPRLCQCLILTSAVSKTEQTSGRKGWQNPNVAGPVAASVGVGNVSGLLRTRKRALGCQDCFKQSWKRCAVIP